jgi:hypothetical protein
MSVDNLLARCRVLGIGLAAGPGGTLVWEADESPPADLLADLANSKATVLATLRATTCETCRRPLDDKGCCWRCCDRRCPCGRLTGSAFIRLCLLCGIKART